MAGNFRISSKQAIGAANLPQQYEDFGNHVFDLRKVILALHEKQKSRSLAIMAT